MENAPKPLTEFINIVKELGGRFVACSAAFPIVDMKSEDLIEGVEVAGVATFVTEAEEAEAADVVLTF